MVRNIRSGIAWRLAVATLSVAGASVILFAIILPATGQEPHPVAPPGEKSPQTESESAEDLRVSRILQQEFKIGLEDVRLADALSQLAELSGVSFQYGEKADPIVRSDTTVTVRYSEGVPLERALRDVLSPHRLTYKIRNGALHIDVRARNKVIRSTSNREWRARVLEHDKASIRLLIPAVNSSQSIPLDVTVRNQGSVPFTVYDTSYCIDCKIALTAENGDKIPYTQRGSHYFNNRAGYSHSSVPILEYRQSLNWRVDLSEAFEKLEPGVYHLSFEADILLWDAEVNAYGQPVIFVTKDLKVVVE